MPELPEVETFKRYLDKTSLNQIIKSIKIIDNRVLNVDEFDLKKLVINNKFTSSNRHGKYLLVNLEQGILIMHFGMTGDLEYYNKRQEDPKYSKVIFQFSNDFKLAYTSRRMFGRLYIAKSIEEFIESKKLGPDAFKMSLEEFKEALNRRTAILKNAMLNQSFIAGIGNIYSDEILFRAKLHPKSRLDALDEKKVKDLFTNIKDVLQFGIDKEGDLSSYPQNFLIPHRKKEEKCPICKNEIVSIDLSGRRGYYCPNCQVE
ncbi:MAG: DNA-formamidopyrimidine glycosylase [Promethearchaeota archaeon]|nr:MAG: DNA-formamidopyrimidine glycosylase [Candidatus Lokiarchaeota archaeon]